MTTNTLSRQESSGTDVTERIATRRLLGVDTQGRDHRWDMVARTLYVLDGGEVAHAKEIRDRPLGDWVAFVEQECGGWETLHFSPSPFDGLEAFAQAGAE